MNRQLYCCFFLQKHSKTSIISGVQAEERRSKIVNYLRDNEFCSLEELSRMLNVSVSTVRRDVNCLSLEGYLRRTHGGAQMILNQPANMLAVVDLPNNAVHSDTKMAIARYCASLILPGQTIIMDAGSTVYYVAQQLVSKHPIVVTNSLPISNLYSGYSQVETHVVGGVIYPRLGVLTGVAAARAHGRPQDHGDIALTAGHIADLGGLIEQGVGALGGKIVIHQLHHGAHPPDRGAHGHAHEALLGNGGVDDAVGAEFLQKALGDGEHVAHDGHILAHDENLFVPEHLLVQGLANGLADSDLLAHLATHLSLSLTYISSSTVAGSG